MENIILKFVYQYLTENNQIIIFWANNIIFKHNKRKFEKVQKNAASSKKGLYLPNIFENKNAISKNFQKNILVFIIKFPTIFSTS